MSTFSREHLDALALLHSESEDERHEAADLLVQDARAAFVIAHYDIIHGAFLKRTDGEYDKRSMLALLEFSREHDERLREALVFGMEPEREPYLRGMAATIARRHGWFEEEAREALRHEPVLTEHLQGLLWGDDYECRGGGGQELCELIVAWGLREAIPGLLKIARDADEPHSRDNAGCALAALGGPQTLLDLRAIYDAPNDHQYFDLQEGEFDTPVHSFRQEVLRGLGENRSDDVMGWLLEGLGDPAPWTRRASAKGLARQEATPKAHNTLYAAVAAEADREVRWEMIETLDVWEATPREGFYEAVSLTFSQGYRRKAILEMIARKGTPRAASWLASCISGSMFPYELKPFAALLLGAFEEPEATETLLRQLGATFGATSMAAARGLFVGAPERATDALLASFGQHPWTERQNREIKGLVDALAECQDPRALALLFGPPLETVLEANNTDLDGRNSWSEAVRDYGLEAKPYLLAHYNADRSRVRSDVRAALFELGDLDTRETFVLPALQEPGHPDCGLALQAVTARAEAYALNAVRALWAANPPSHLRQSMLAYFGAMGAGEILAAIEPGSLPTDVERIALWRARGDGDALLAWLSASESGADGRGQAIDALVSSQDRMLLPWLVRAVEARDPLLDDCLQAMMRLRPGDAGIAAAHAVAMDESLERETRVWGAAAAFVQEDNPHELWVMLRDAYRDGYSDAWFFRLQAIQAYIWAKWKHAPSNLAHALGDLDVWIRSEAAWGLGHIGGEQARDALIARGLSDGAVSVRVAACEALTKFPDDEVVVEALASALQERRKTIRLAALDALGALGAISQREPVEACLGDRYTDVREKARNVLDALLGDSALPATASGPPGKSR